MARLETAHRVRRPRIAGALFFAALLIVSDARAAVAASAPRVDGIVAPVDPVAAGSVVAVSATFTDADSTAHTALWTWGDGSTTAGAVASGTVTGSHTYTQAGVFRLSLAVRDDSGASGTASFEFVVVYDPSGGFVTGGGWINSPAGAYPADPALTGRATFGLVAKYKPGASEPQGTTEFQFRAADLNFHSVDYDWLVVAGARAQFKGTGTIQGRAGLYRFFVTAIDGDLLGGGAPDRFRIKIADGGVVYDNQVGAADDADPVMALGGGSIVIHKSKAEKPVNHAPVANAGPDQTAAIGQLVTLDGSASSDPDGDALTFAWSLVSVPAGSASTLTDASSVAAHLTPDLAGIYVVQLIVNDGTLSSAPDTATITVSLSNHAPLAAPDSYPASEDSALVVAAPGVLANDSDADGDALSALLVSGPLHGTLVLGANGSFTYTPEANFNGLDSFSYRASDGTALSATTTVSLNVAAVNDPPVANAGADQTVSTSQLVTLDGSGSSDPDGDVLLYVWTIVSAPAASTATLSDPTSVMPTFTPDLGGTYEIELIVGDGSATDADQVTLTVSQTERVPIAANDSYSAVEDTALTVAAPGVLVNDSDADGDPLSALLASGPAHGTLTLNVSGSFVYTPNANYAGPDSFTYRASDGIADSNTATVNIDVVAVNDPPEANDDVATTPEDTAVMISVLANDNDVDGSIDLTSFLIVAPPVHGTTQVADPATGLIQYTPFTDFHGTDTFTYRICDFAGACDTALVTVSVVPLNDAPVAMPDAYSGTEDAALSVAAPGILANDTDADGDTLTAVLLSGPGHGTLTLGPNGSFTYTPNANFAGPDSFTYRAFDGTADSAQATVSINVAAVNDAPVAGDDAATTNEDTPVVIDVTANDTDVDGDLVATSVSVVVPPTRGTTAVDPANGRITYTPGPDFNGSDSFTYQVCDAALACDTAAVTVMVSPVNDAPVVNAGADQSALTGQLVTLNATFADPDTADTHVASISWGDGTSTDPAPLDETARTVVSSHVYALPGSYIVTVEVTDSFGASDSDTATITVSLSNHAPLAAPDSYPASEDSALVVAAPGVLANDSDADGDALSALLVSGPLHGTLVLGANGSFTYTPEANFNGLDSFSYRASDGTALSATTTVSLNVAAVNDPPVASDDAATTDEDTPVVIDVLANDSDVDGALVPSSLSITLAPVHGGATVDPLTGAVTYTPQANFHGSDSFTYRICDGLGACTFAVVVISVLAVNDPPVADAGDDQTASTGQLVTLDGSGSSDPDGDTITYLWTIVSAPAGSSAVLSGATTSAPTFTPDRNGLYRLELTVSDGTTTSSDQVDVTVLGAITLAPDPLNLSINSVGSLTITLSAAAGPAGQLVNLSTNGSLVSIPSSVLVPAGQMSITFDVTTGAASGSVLVTAIASGFASDSATVNVAAGTLLLTLEDELVGVGRSTDGIVTLFSPAPPGGTIVTLVVANTGIATVTPATVNIAAGATQGVFFVTGVAVGVTTLTGSAPGYLPADASVTVTDALISIGNIPEIGPDETEGVPLSLTKPAPPGGLTVTLITTAPNVATVSPTVTVPAGQFLPPSNPQVTGHALGTTEIIASAPGFAPGHRNVVVALKLTFSPTSLPLGANTTRDITLLLSHTAPAGGLTVQLHADNANVATVPATATFAAGLTSVVIPVTGVATGTTTLRASATGIAETTASIIVGAPITIANQSIGKDLQVTVGGSLGVPAPAGNLPVTYTSSDPSLLVVSSSPTAAGAASVTVSVQAGTFGLPAVYFQALAGSGTVHVIASALGYTSGDSTVTLTPSGFWIWAPGFAQSFTTNSFAANSDVILSSIRLTPTLQSAGEQEVRGGLSLSVVVTSSNTAVGTIASPVAFVGGTGARKTTQFDPQGPGVSILSIPVPVPGFSIPPTALQTVTATVVAPTVKFFNINSLLVGRDLQGGINVQLESTPPSPVDVTVSVVPGGEGIVSLTKVVGAEGTSSVTFNGITNVNVLTLWVQGRTLDDTQLIVTAAGYNSSTLPVSVTPSAFWIWAPGFAQSFTTNSFAANSDVIVSSIRLTPTLQSAGEQDVRGGLTVNVDVKSSNTAVGTITTSPVEFLGGTGARKITRFDPQGPGVTILSLPVPVPGFSIPPTALQTVTATVVAPSVRFFNVTQLTVGRDLQSGVNVQLESAPPGPVDITVSVSGSGTGLVTLTKTRTIEGTSSVTFTGVTTTNLQTLWVQGRTLGNIQLTVSAAGYTSSTLAVTVTQAGFWTFAPGFATSFTTNTFAAPSSLFVRAAQLTPALLPGTEQELRGGTSADVIVTSSNTAVGSIVASPIHITGGGASTNTALFDPQLVGTTTLSIATPAGFTTPATGQSILATVRAPEVRISLANVSSSRIGRDLQLAVQVTLEDAPPEPVDVTITVAPGGEGIVSISKVRTAEGTSTVTFAGVTSIAANILYIQGRALGSTQLAGVAAGYNDATAAIAVDPAGFRTYGPSFATAITTTSGAPNITVSVTSSRLDPVTLNVASDQEVRGGLNLSVPVTSSNTAVGGITASPIVWNGGTGATKQTFFDPLSVGTTVVSIPAPVTGFVVPSNGSTTITFAVNP